MPRKLLYRTDFLPYHVTARTNNKVPFHVEMSQMWNIISIECFSASLRFDVEIHALVLMPNHFHMLITVPTFDLGKVMTVLMSNITKRSHEISGNRGHLFGGPYHWSLINSSLYFSHALKYVYRNPIKGGLCRTVEDYPYSSLFGLLGRDRLDFPIYFTRSGMEVMLPSENPIQCLDWLNTPFSNEVEKKIQMGLRKKIFQQTKDLKTRRGCDLLEKVL